MDPVSHETIVTLHGGQFAELFACTLQNCLWKLDPKQSLFDVFLFRNYLYLVAVIGAPLFRWLFGGKNDKKKGHSESNGGGRGCGRTRFAPTGMNETRGHFAFHRRFRPGHDVGTRRLSELQHCSDETRGHFAFHRRFRPGHDVGTRRLSSLSG